MTDKPSPRYVEVVSLRDESRHIVMPKAQERQLVDAPEPGFVLDPVTGKYRRARPGRRAWLTFAR